MKREELKGISEIRKLHPSKIKAFLSLLCKFQVMIYYSNHSWDHPFFKMILFIYSWEIQRKRGAETQAEGEIGLLPKSPMWDLIRYPGIMPWAEGRRSTSKPLMCPPLIQYQKDPLTVNFILNLSKPLRIDYMYSYI